MESFANLSKELQYIAKTELNEVSHRANEDIAHIRSWILKQPHLHARTDDKVLTIFLRSCKFKLEKTKRRVELYYTMKTALPNLFTKRDPLEPEFQYVFNQKAICVLPVLPESPLLIMVRLAKMDPDSVPLFDLLKASMVFHEAGLLEYANSSVVGQVLLFDYQNSTLKFVTQLSPAFLKTLITYYDVACPSRLKAVYFINTPRIFTSVFNIIKSFLSKKMQQRVFMHALGDKLDIENHFPSSILPFEYGGQGGSFSSMSEQFQSLVEKNRAWFIEDEQYKYVEKNRSSTVSAETNLFHLDGSFRKLEID